MHMFISSSISGSGTLQAALANAVLLLWNALPAFTGIRQTVGATGICVYLYLWVFCGGSLEQTSIIVNYLQPWAETPSGRLQGGGEQQYVSYTGVHMVLSSQTGAEMRMAAPSSTFSTSLSPPSESSSSLRSASTAGNHLPCHSLFCLWRRK